MHVCSILKNSKSVCLELFIWFLPEQKSVCASWSFSVSPAGYLFGLTPNQTFKMDFCFYLIYFFLFGKSCDYICLVYFQHLIKQKLGKKAPKRTNIKLIFYIIYEVLKINIIFRNTFYIVWNKVKPYQSKLIMKILRF